jgi:hypothetical protein
MQMTRCGPLAGGLGMELTTPHYEKYILQRFI